MVDKCRGWEKGVNVGERVQTSHYRMYEFQGSNVQKSDITI